MFLGNVVGCKISDWYGRRYTFLGVTVLMGIGQGVSAAAFDPYSYGIARFISGVGLSGSFLKQSIYFARNCSEYIFDWASQDSWA